MFWASLVAALLALPLAVDREQWIGPRPHYAQAELALMALSTIRALMYAAYMWLAANAGAMFATLPCYAVTLWGVPWVMSLRDEQFSAWGLGRHGGQAHWAASNVIASEMRAFSLAARSSIDCHRWRARIAGTTHYQASSQIKAAAPTYLSNSPWLCVIEHKRCAAISALQCTASISILLGA